jgi:hypothetical protein
MRDALRTFRDAADWALIEHLKDPGRDARRVFDYVSADVVDATKSRQQPVTYGSLPV